MASVTQRIKSIQQPYGGYLPIKYFSKEQLNDNVHLNDEENIHSSLIGIAVDYLTRFMLGDTIEKAFHISTLGAIQIGMQSKATLLKSKIIGLDNNSIIAACKLAGFDVCYRSSIVAYKPIEDINPNISTIENIRTMVKRSLTFWEKYGPVSHSEPTFEGGYSALVNTGDGDYVTKDTLWDFKVSKSAPTTKHTLQILMYYIMGIHSIHSYFKELKNLGFFNPRLNIVYICPISCITAELIAEIENNVICYNQNVISQQKLTTKQHISSTSKTPSYSVADICNATGQKKSTVYNDIHEGKLFANKKGNKYEIPYEEFIRYIDYVKTKHKTILITNIVLVGLLLLFLIVILGIIP